MNNTALLLLDLQNDFIHVEGAYGRAGQSEAAIAALPAKLKPLADLMRSRGGVIVATLFTLVAGRGGEPIIQRENGEWDWIQDGRDRPKREP